MLSWCKWTKHSKCKYSSNQWISDNNCFSKLLSLGTIDYAAFLWPSLVDSLCDLFLESSTQVRLTCGVGGQGGSNLLWVVTGGSTERVAGYWALALLWACDTGVFIFWKLIKLWLLIFLVSLLHFQKKIRGRSGIYMSFYWMTYKVYCKSQEWSVRSPVCIACHH